MLSNSQIPDMISTAARENGLGSGVVRDFIQELRDVGGILIEQLQRLQIYYHQQEQQAAG